MQDFMDNKRMLIERRMYALYGHWIDEDSTTGRNRLYKLCEAIETRIMMGTIRQLVSRRVESIVWIHDGVYVHKAMSFEEVEEEFQGQARQLGLVLEIRKEDLGEELLKEKEKHAKEHENEEADTNGEVEDILSWGRDEQQERRETVDLTKPYRDAPVKFQKNWESAVNGPVE